MDSSIIILSQEQRKELTTIPENISDYVMAKYYLSSTYKCNFLGADNKQ